jgi:hypothetical protein
MMQLSPAEISLLREVRVSDEDHGGLRASELGADELETLARLCDLGLVEAQMEYGEAPDGEEDERDAGDNAQCFRITGSGVAVLADLA